MEREKLFYGSERKYSPQLNHFLFQNGPGADYGSGPSLDTNLKTQHTTRFKNHKPKPNQTVELKQDSVLQAPML